MPIRFIRFAQSGIILAGAVIAGSALADDATVDPADQPDFSVLDFSVLGEATPEVPIRSRPAPATSGTPTAIIGNRTERLDGSVAGSAGQRLPTPWETRIGVDFGLAAPATLPQPDALMTRQAQDHGTGWANVTVPGVDAPISWDKATIDARVDPDSDQGKLSTSLSRSVPVGGGVSLTLKNGYAITQSLASPSGMPPSAAATTRTFSSDGALRVELPTATAFSAGARMSTTDDRVLRTLSAEQKLFDTPLSVTGSIDERPTGDTDKSIKAGFKHTW